MCGRFSFAATDKIIEEHFGFAPGKEYIPSHNVAPSQKRPIITNENNNRFSYFNWAYFPFWTKEISASKAIINARIETLNTKVSFRHLTNKKRCLIPADGYYEWKNSSGGKIPYYFYTKPNEIFSMAGLWDEFPVKGSLYSCFCIITIPAKACAKEIHHRMPMIIKKEDYHKWLDASKEIKEENYSFSYENMHNHSIRSLVNSPQNNNAAIKKAYSYPENPSLDF